MPSAQWLWSRYPTEIESDLSLYHRRSIAEWHRYPERVNGSRMSSREFLVLVSHLPPDSEFKKAWGPDGFSETQRVAAFSANTLSRLLRATHVAHGGEDYEAALVLSPSERAEQAVEDDFVEDARGGFMNQAFG